MGQYYKGVILNEEKTEVINALNCYAHGNGAKLMEHSYIGSHYVRAYEHLLATTFKGKPFVWCGDYADNDWYSKGWTFDDNKAKDNFYNKYGYNFEGRLMDNEFYPTLPYNKLRYYKYLLNYDTKEYVKLPKYRKDKWVIHPLPLLCADGNGRGGGDYYGTNENMVGIWAYNHIGIGNDIPTEGFWKELKITFEEER